MPDLFALPRDRTRRERRRRSRWPRRVGAVFALVVGLPLMRLSGLAAGIATFAVLEITHNLLSTDDKIGPGPNTFSLGPRDDRPGRRRSARCSPSSSPSRTSGAVSAVCCAPRARIPPQRGRPGSRSTASGWSRSSSPARSPASPAALRPPAAARQPARSLSRPDLHHAGDARGRRRHEPLGRRRRRARGERARLVPRRGRERRRIFGTTINLPSGTRVVVEGVLMAIVLILRPSGLTGGREFRLPRWRRS